jgi:kumamolisin
MSSSSRSTGWDAVDTAYQDLGKALTALKSARAVPTRGAARTYEKHHQRWSAGRKFRSHDYIKYPAPAGLRPRIPEGWKVLDLCAAYSFPTGLAGGGTIGILELGGGYQQSDLDKFASDNGLPPIAVTDVPVNGGQNSPGGKADGEVLLDIQVAAAAYFYCTGSVPAIRMYFAGNDASSFAAVINQAVSDGCDVLSISWGADEAAWDADVAQQLDNAAESATNSGLIIFAASGDNSSSDGDAGANVDLPSACPHIIGCGGTSKPRSGEEVVWGNGSTDGQGTGGGYSVLFPPQDWQVDAPPSPGQPGRMVPDMAANADPNTGYFVVIGGSETLIGGTSAVAPLYSGLFAAFGQKLGFVTPTLWKHPEAFEDIVDGSNGSYQAAQGPDPCTGLGVPIGDKLGALFATPHVRRARNRKR